MLNPVLRSIPLRYLLAGLLLMVLAASSFEGTAYASNHQNKQQNTQQRSTPQKEPPMRTRYGVKWIKVDLSEQRLYALEGNRIVFSTRVSTGTAKYPTVTGTFRVYVKLLSTRMRGGTGRDRYDLPNVPHTMYFYRGYGIHGAYWHNNFGRRMSHGCVNLPLGAARWLFSWTPTGTTVVVQR